MLHVAHHAAVLPARAPQGEGTGQLLVIVDSLQGFEHHHDAPVALCEEFAQPVAKSATLRPKQHVAGLQLRAACPTTVADWAAVSRQGFDSLCTVDPAQELSNSIPRRVHEVLHRAVQDPRRHLGTDLPRSVLPQMLQGRSELALISLMFGLKTPRTACVSQTVREDAF